MTTNKKIYLGIDPGKDKTGVALVAVAVEPNGAAETSGAGEASLSAPVGGGGPRLHGGGGDKASGKNADVISIRPEGAGDRAQHGGGASRRDPKILAETILPTRDFVSHLKTFLSTTPITAIIMGNGTTSQKMQQQLEKAFPQLPFHVVNEYNTTQEAKKLYWKIHPPTGWKKLFPTALFDPPSPVDGLAAAVQVFRYLCDKTGKSS